MWGGISQQSSQFAAVVDVVRIEAVVTDGTGRFVSDLRRGDFSLLEDGVEQELLDVQLVDVTAGSVASLAESSGVRKPSRQTVAPSNLSAVVFFLDFPGLYFQNKLRFVDSLLSMLESIAEVRVPHAVYFVDIEGHLREMVGLTRDVDALADAVRRTRAMPLVQTRDDLLAFLESDVGGMTRWAQSMQRRRALATYELLAEFVRALTARPGRKAVVWVSTGVDLATYDSVTSSRTDDPREGFRFYSVDDERTAAQRKLHEAANAANVSIYSVDPSSLHEFYGLGDSPRAGTVADARGNSLRDAAVSTGGQSFIAWSELTRVLERVEADASAFYVLSYEPSHDPAPDEFHEVVVKVSRPDVEVRSRRGYIHRTGDARRRDMVAGALAVPGVVSGLDVAAQGIRAVNADGQSLLVTALAIDVSSQEGVRDPGATGPLLLYATAHNREGTLVAHSEEAVPTTAGPESGYPPATWPGALASYRLRWLLEPGNYSVHVAVLDPQTDRIGATAFDVEIVDDGGWRSSDPAVLTRASNGATSVAVGGILFSGQQALVYVEVYGGQQPTLVAEVWREDGQPAGSDPPAAVTGPPQRLERDGSLYRGSVELPMLAPGEYRISVVVVDDPAGMRRVTSAPLRVLEQQ